MQNVEAKGMPCAKALGQENVSKVFSIERKKGRPLSWGLRIIITRFDFIARVIESSEEVSNLENGPVWYMILNCSLWVGMVCRKMRGNESLVKLIHSGNNDDCLTWGKGDSVNGEVDRGQKKKNLGQQLGFPCG